jgi:hypothetical protein
MSDFPRHDKMQDLRRQFREAGPDEYARRLALVAAMRELRDEARADTSDERLDGDSLSLRKAALWLGADRVRELEKLDPTSRLALVETLEAAARHAGMTDPEVSAGIRGASRDDLRAAYEQLPDPEDSEPEDERTDTMTDTESTARYRMNRDAHTAWTRPLERKANDEDKTRLDAASRGFDALERDRSEYESRRPMTPDHARLDADEGATEEAAARQRMNARYHAAASRPFDKFGDIVEEDGQ